MGSRTLLKPAEVASALEKLPGWRHQGRSLVRLFLFETYLEGLEFAASLGRAADRVDHHPDLEIGYCRVTVRWTTHDAGGLTRLDLQGAKKADALREASGRR